MSNLLTVEDVSLLRPVGSRLDTMINNCPECAFLVLCLLVEKSLAMRAVTETTSDECYRLAILKELAINWKNKILFLLSGILRKDTQLDVVDALTDLGDLDANLQLELYHDLNHKQNPILKLQKTIAFFKKNFQDDGFWVVRKSLCGKYSDSGHFFVLAKHEDKLYVIDATKHNSIIFDINDKDSLGNIISSFMANECFTFVPFLLITPQK